MHPLLSIKKAVERHKAGKHLDENEISLLFDDVTEMLKEDLIGPLFIQELRELFPSELDDAMKETARQKGGFTKDKTGRGFSTLHFKDYYGAESSIQKSSIASLHCIWLGVDDADPQIMASDAIKLCLPNHGQTTGWVPYEVPEQVLMNTRMHLTQAMAKQLIPILQHFVKTGELPE